LRTTRTLIAMLAVAALAVTACGPAATPSPAPATPPPATATPAAETPAPPTAEPVEFLACMVSDTGGIDDKSFNQNAWDGMERAEAELGVEVKFLESEREEDYLRNIQQFISEDCDIIVTVGFLLGDATKAAAEANPNQRFAIVDFAYDPVLPNVEGLLYNTAEAAMLAGYASASWSKTGIMGTFGGINIGGPVTDFMDGFVAGANYWNQQKDANVRVLGWNPVTKEGAFTGNFSSTDDAKNLTAGMLQEGADVILAVGGPIGQGTFAAIEEANADAVGLGVDVDWTETVPQYSSLMLTHILKRIDNSVFQAIERALNGDAPQAVFVNTLENSGVGLGDFHDYDDEISAETKQEIEALTQAIISGQVKPSDYFAAQ
jgi:basic membrane protein A and related proteins